MAPTRAHTHEITWWHEEGRVVGRITCSAAVGAPCRLLCVPDEETGPPCEDRDHAHAFADAGHCLLVAAAQRSGALALHDGPSGEPLRSGPVTAQPDVHGWVWSYPAVAAARALPQTPGRRSSAA